jgi:DNA-binding LytR/AlgR family response regulator
MNSIKCVIIDDEELARKLLETYVKKVDFLEWQGSFENPLDGLKFLRSNNTDLLFLDIQMPEIMGTEFVELITKLKTRVVFTTAYSEYALKGFELNAMDYLLKPITFTRFLGAVEKFPLDKTQHISNSEQIVIKSGYDLYKVKSEEVLYVESYGEYVHYHLENGKKIIANQSLTKLLSSLPDSFLRVHRSFIVNGKRVSGLKGRELTIDNKAIPISNSYYEKVKAKLFS